MKQNISRFLIYWISMMISFVLFAMMVYTREASWFVFAGFSFLLVLNFYGGMVLFAHDVLSGSDRAIRNYDKPAPKKPNKKKVYKGLMYFCLGLYVVILILGAFV